MATDRFQKFIIGVSIGLAIVGVGLLVASFATDHWIESHPEKTNSTSVNSTRQSSAIITFGLFSGYQSIDYGFGARSFTTKIKCDTSENACAFIGIGRDSPGKDGLDSLIAEMKNHTNGEGKSMEDYGLFDFRLYVASMVMLALAMVWGIVTIGFSIFNVAGRPIETITGTSGLYIWNILALIFDVIGIGLYLGLYFSQLKLNILQAKDRRSGFSTKDETDLDYSFFFTVGAAGAFFINLVLLALSNRGISCNHKHVGEKEMDNGMILY